MVKEDESQGWRQRNQTIKLYCITSVVLGFIGVLLLLLKKQQKQNQMSVLNTIAKVMRLYTFI